MSGASKSGPSSRELADWLAKDGQLLIPLVELLEKGERAIDEVIDVMGRATIEAVLQMSAEQVAGPKEQGRRDADRELYWHGVQAGRVALKERQLRVDKPRLRKKRARADEPGEVEIPGVCGVAGGPATGRPDAGVGAAGRVDAQVRDSAACAGRPGWGEQAREEMTSLVEASVAEATRPLPTREEMTSLVEASVAEATRPLPTREEMTSLVEASVTEGILPVATRNEIQALTLKVDAVNAQSIRSNTILLTVMDCIIDLNSTDPAAQRDLPGSCQRAQERAEQELRP